jgi:signal transduction histidine kinase
VGASAKEPQPHIEALEVFVDVLSQLDAEAAPDEFYNRLCEVICRLASMERAVIFRYDGARRRVRAAGAHGLDVAEFSGAYVTVESAPMARRALEQDQVVEVAGDFGHELPALWADRLRGRHLACTPMAAGGRWVGVVVSDRPASSPALSPEERDALWTLGKIAALAAWSRIATRQSEKARQLQQRIDMAREIHDGVIQRLFGVALALSSEAPSREELERCAEEVQIALSDLRTALRRPLGRTPRPTETTLEEEVERLAAEHPELGVTFDHEGDAELPAELEPLAQSVLVEAVRNAHKHAKPTRVAVRVARQDGTFVLEVTNDGVRGRSRRTGMGLRLAALEALQCGGVIEFGERGADSWQVRLVVPDEHS